MNNNYNIIKLNKNMSFTIPDSFNKKEELYILKYAKYFCLLNKNKKNEFINILLPILEKNKYNSYYRRLSRYISSYMLSTIKTNTKNQIILPQEIIDLYNIRNEIIVEENKDNILFFPKLNEYKKYKKSHI